MIVRRKNFAVVGYAVETKQERFLRNKPISVLDCQSENSGFGRARGSKDALVAVAQKPRSRRLFGQRVMNRGTGNVGPDRLRSLFERAQVADAEFPRLIDR
jgi:hypothetical protein